VEHCQNATKITLKIWLATVRLFDKVITSCNNKFGLIWDYKTSKELQKKMLGLGDQQEVLNMGVPWHNWLVLGPESPNIFCLVLFRTTKLQYTYKNILRAGKSSGRPQYRHFPAQLALSGFRVYKRFLFCLII
jgi:hypothetical protein